MQLVFNQPYKPSSSSPLFVVFLPISQLIKAYTLTTTIKVCNQRSPSQTMKLSAHATALLASSVATAPTSTFLTLPSASSSSSSATTITATTTPDPTLTTSHLQAPTSYPSRDFVHDEPIPWPARRTSFPKRTPQPLDSSPSSTSPSNMDPTPLSPTRTVYTTASPTTVYTTAIYTPRPLFPSPSSSVAYETDAHQYDVVDWRGHTKAQKEAPSRCPRFVKWMLWTCWEDNTWFERPWPTKENNWGRGWGHGEGDEKKAKDEGQGDGEGEEK